MHRILLLSAALVGVFCGAAESRPLPGPTTMFGPNCHAISRAAKQDTLFVGTVLGGRTTGHRWGDGTMTDYRTFQGCFISAQACQTWVAGHARRHAREPAFAHCTQVYVGLKP